MVHSCCYDSSTCNNRNPADRHYLRFNLLSVVEGQTVPKLIDDVDDRRCSYCPANATSVAVGRKMTLLHEFVSNQKRLLELELRAEEDAGVDPTNKDDASRDGGFVLRNIDIIDTTVGLYGRTVVTFGNASQQQSVTDESATMTTNKNGGRSSTSSSSHLLQAHRLTVGDEVQILPNNGKGFQGKKKSRHIGGVVCAIDDVSISIALFSEDASSNSKQSTAAKKWKKAGSKEIDERHHDDDGDGEMLGGNPPYALIPKSNIEIHQKMIAALDDLDKYGVDHPIAGSIVMAAFEPNKPMHSTTMTRSRIESLELECNLESSRLDYSQREAVVMALHSDSPIYLIHGRKYIFCFETQ